LTGTFTPERAASLSATDWRRDSPGFTGDGLRRNLIAVDALSTVAERHRVTTSSVAVAWTLSFDGLTGAIVGARKPEQIADWIDAASLRLTADDLDGIADALASAGVGSGPVRPERAEVDA
jgi:aryl-alcohol dehydrogenase-like predicted oxidoreductase